MIILENVFQKILHKEERAWPRLQCKYITECHDLHGNLWACRIINISGRGLGIFSSAVLRTGEIVYIAEPDIKAVVVWISAGRMGIRVCN
jgi:hypothetical protein